MISFDSDRGLPVCCSAARVICSERWRCRVFGQESGRVRRPCCVSAGRGWLSVCAPRRMTVTAIIRVAGREPSCPRFGSLVFDLCVCVCLCACTKVQPTCFTRWWHVYSLAQFSPFWRRYDYVRAVSLHPGELRQQQKIGR